MMEHRTRSYGSLMAAPGPVGAVAGCCDRVDGLPAFDSLGATCHAVDEVVDRSGEAPEPAVKFPGSGKDTGKSAMCTSTVEVLWFDNDEACEDVYQLLADARNAWYTVEQ